MKCLAIKIFAWNFLQFPIQKLTFLLILYFYDVMNYGN